MSGGDGAGRVLVVDDSRAIRQILSRSLRAGGYEVLEAGNGQEGVDTCRVAQPDLVLLDVDMPVLNGHEAMAQLRADPLTAEVPVLFLTARTSATDVAAGLGLGAQDYLRKPCEPAELLARVEIAIRSARMQQQLRQHAQQLDNLSTTDPLTGLGNRRRLELRVAELRDTQAPEWPVAVAIMDIDHFKRINDTSGHLVGDGVLTLLGSRLRAAAVDADTLVRWGGEEFMVLRDGESAGQLGTTVESMRRAAGASPMAVGLDHLVSITVSGGWAQGTLGDIEATIAAADEALYRAKRGGRNRLVRG